MSDNNKPVIIRYDGPALADHRMDVHELAPALLSLADICKNANRAFNGDRTGLNVLVNANTEQHCFELSLEFVMTLFEQAKSLAGIEKPKTPEEILAWIGIIGSGATATTLSLIKLIKALNGKEVESVETVQIDGKSVINVSIQGDNNNVEVLQTSPEVLALAKNEDNLRHIKRLVSPLVRDGYESLEFERGPKDRVELTREDARIIDSIDAGEMADAIDEKEDPQVVTAWIKVHAPVYDPEATRWRFQFDGRTEYMDIRDTGIAQAAIDRGGALVDDTYKVKLQMVQSKTSTRMTYKVLEVLEFHPARLTDQGDLDI